MKALVVIKKSDYINNVQDEKDLNNNSKIHKEVVEKLTGQSVNVLVKGLLYPICPVIYEELPPRKLLELADDSALGLSFEIDDELLSKLIVYHDYYIFGNRQLDCTVDEFIEKEVYKNSLNIKKNTAGNFLYSESILDYPHKLVNLERIVLEDGTVEELN